MKTSKHLGSRIECLHQLTKPLFLDRVDWSHIFTDVLGNGRSYLLPSAGGMAIWCATGKSLLQRLRLEFLLLHVNVTQPCVGCFFSLTLSVFFVMFLSQVIK